MTAVACLRVAVEADRTGLSPAVLGPLVAKFTGAYLETRWQWPRRFAPLSHYSFLLTDPRADTLNVEELARLSDELQIKLFGERDAGEVALMLFEGPPEAVTAFAALDAHTVAAALADPSLLPPGGQLRRILSAEASDPSDAEEEHERRVESPHWEELHRSRADPSADLADTALPQLEGLQGIYFTPRQVFVGDIVSSTPGSARVHYSVVEGLAHMPPDPAAFDADCVVTASRMLDSLPHAGLLHLPLCYSNLIHASQRESYERMLSVLPDDRRAQLAAVVYDTPRDPAFGALSLVRSTLGKYVGSISLQVVDPGFQIEKLPDQAVAAVTLVLPEADRRIRSAVLHRFAERLDLFKRKRIWAGVTNVRSKVELVMCADLRVPFVTGPAVCRLQTHAMGGRLQPLSELPVLVA